MTVILFLAAAFLAYANGANDNFKGVASLYSMERKGLLRSHDHLEAGRIRRVYTSTPRGRKALSLAKEKVYELFGALFQDEPTHKEGRKSRS
jgi:DNA-binding PadR family transcriptional regulator